MKDKDLIKKYAEVLYWQDKNPKKLIGTNIEHLKSEISKRNLFHKAKKLSDDLWSKREKRA
jgi:hypothetical protein